MRRLIIGFVFCVAWSGNAWAELDIPKVTYPKLSTEGASAEAFVPKGWKLEAEHKGDFNKDGSDDLLILLRMNDPKNVIEHDALGQNPFDTNPRILAVALAGPENKPYRLALQNQKLIARPDIPAADDLLSELGGIAVERDTFTVALHQFMSAGSWSSGLTTYRFRHGKRGFELIGYESSTLIRNSGEDTKVSINYLTGKVKISTGTMQDDEVKVEWRKLKKKRLLLIDEIGDGLEFNPTY
jgi:hypothetical protein